MSVPTKSYGQASDRSPPPPFAKPRPLGATCYESLITRMPQIIITYKTYTTTFPRLSEEEFTGFQSVARNNPTKKVFPEKSFAEFLIEFYFEFRLSFILMLGLGILLGFLELEHFLILAFVPLFLWLILGGIVSILNFTDNYRYCNKYLLALNEKLLEFKTYEEYLYFHTFESAKY